MLADFVRPHLLVDVVNGKDSVERMVRVIKFYLSGFSSMRGNTDLAKKPYNPVQGELFRCVWKPHKVDGKKKHHGGRKTRMNYGAGAAAEGGGSLDTPKEYKSGDVFRVPTGRCLLPADPDCVTFLGEQVSHHPPVTAIFALCQNAAITLSGSLEIKVQADYRFSLWRPLKGVKAQHLGKLVIHDKRHREKYSLSFPSAYASDLLSVPKLDFVGTSKIVSSSGLTAAMVFPDSSKKEDRFLVDASVFRTGSKKPVGVAAKGRWNGAITITRPNGFVEVVEVRKLPSETKRCRPLAEQHWLESQRVWRKVTRAMDEEDSDRAVKEKNKVEERHRKIVVQPTHFKFSKSTKAISGASKSEGRGRWKIVC